MACVEQADAIITSSRKKGSVGTSLRCSSLRPTFSEDAGFALKSKIGSMLSLKNKSKESGTCGERERRPKARHLKLGRAARYSAPQSASIFLRLAICFGKRPPSLTPEGRTGPARRLVEVAKLPQTCRNATNVILTGDLRIFKGFFFAFTRHLHLDSPLNRQRRNCEVGLKMTAPYADRRIEKERHMPWHSARACQRGHHVASLLQIASRRLLDQPRPRLPVWLTVRERCRRRLGPQARS